MIEREPQEWLLQTLSAIIIELNALAAMMDESNVFDKQALRAGLETLEHMTRTALAQARLNTGEVSTPELEGTTLAEALSNLIEETAEKWGLSSRVSFSGVDERGRPREHELPRSSERLLYLVAQEALYRVRQHAGARRVRLSLSYNQEDVQMSVEDDGTLATIVEESLVPALSSPGVPSSSLTGAQGDRDEAGDTDGSTRRGTSRVATDETGPLLDLRYRIESLGGVLESSHNEQGTRLLVRLPYAPHIHEREERSLVPVVTAPLRRPTALVPPAQATRVLVVDGQAVTRAGLSRLLESYPDLQVIGEAADGVQAVSETIELGPQVVLMDSQLPNGQSLEALRQIKQLNLDTHVLLLSAQDREEYLYETLRAGADGYVLKDIAPDELAQAVRIVARGETVVQPQLAGRLLSRVGKQGRGAPYESLTARELEVLRLLARGLRNKEIASRLYVSERTVNFHLANIYQKLNVSGRTEALSRALEQGLISA